MRDVNGIFKSLGMQDTEQVIDSDDLLATGATESSEIFESRGFAALKVFAFSNLSFRIDFIERCTCEDDEDQQPDGARTLSVTSTLDSTTGRQFVAETFPVHGQFIRVDMVNTGGGTQTQKRFCAYLLPLGDEGGGAGGGGTGSEDGPGATIATKADGVVPAGVETPIIGAADIPLGTRRMTIKNVGANPIRIKGSGEGGGAARGIEVDADESITFGGRDGSIDELDGFSTGGTTLSFIFERD